MRFDYVHQATILGLDCEHNLENLCYRFTFIGPNDTRGHLLLRGCYKPPPHIRGNKD